MDASLSLYHHQKQLGIPFNVSSKASKNCKRAREKKTVKALFHLFPPPQETRRELERSSFFLSPLPCQCALLYCGAGLYVLESVQDFLIKLDMKPSVHLVEISIFSLNLIIVGLMNRANKNWAQFQEIKYLKYQNFQEKFLMKVGLLVKYSSQKKKFCTNLEMFKEVVHNFGKSDIDMIQ